MAAKEQKPILTGQRFKTRKRDEKVKYDASTFCEQVVAGLNEAAGDFEEVAKYLDQAGSTLDYRRYAEPLLDTLIAGGMLAPGGRVEATTKSEVCLFMCEPMVEAVRQYLQIITRLIRRYKYLQKSFSDNMKKVLLFTKAFSEQERRALAIFTGLCLSKGLLEASVISNLLSVEMLVKEGLTLEFGTVMLQTWMTEKGIAHINSSLRRAHLENRLLEFLPPTRQTPEHFDLHFSQSGLEEIVKLRRAHENAEYKKKLREEVSELIAQDASQEEVIDRCQEHMAKTTISDVDITVIMWRCIMSSVEWNKKEELVAEQALKHLKVYSPLFLPFCQQGTAQLTLLIKMQGFCYDHMNFLKIFHKIVLLFYKNDVLTEQAILKWYSDSHVAKGKSVFLKQMQRMVEWLNTAEEEEEEEEEGEGEEPDSQAPATASAAD